MVPVMKADRSPSVHSQPPLDIGFAKLGHGQHQKKSLVSKGVSPGTQAGVAHLPKPDVGNGGRIHAAAL
jgi:hypothetical protein